MRHARWDVLQFLKSSYAKGVLSGFVGTVAGATVWLVARDMM